MTKPVCLDAPVVSLSREESNQTQGAGEPSSTSAPVVPYQFRVKELLQTGAALEALRWLEREPSLHTQPEYHFWVATVLCSLGRHSEGLAEIEKELQHNPHFEAAQQCKAEIQQALELPTFGSRNLAERSWNTSIPRDFLLRIQKSLHGFSYKGVPMLKNPFDLALYAKLLWDAKPRTIIEIGSKSGGSAVWFADTLRNYAIDGHIYSVDIIKVNDVHDPLVTFLEGDGRKLELTWTDDFIRSLPRPLFVVEDADHSYETSLAVLKFFDRSLRPNEYIVIEDGIITDLAAAPGFLSGPHQALKEFLEARHADYEIASEYADFFGYNVTWGTNGFLKRKA